MLGVSVMYARAFSLWIRNGRLHERSTIKYNRVSSTLGIIRSTTEYSSVSQFSARV
jgi:hypothetical protein